MKKSSTRSIRNSSFKHSLAKEAEKVVKILSKLYRESLVERIGKGSPYRVWVSTVLSQRTRDETTERVSEEFFRHFGSLESLANARVDEIKSLIKSVGFSNQKAHNLMRAARMILEKFNGKIPDTEEELLTLPGVGQKTAGCILVYAYGKPAVPVDTHVHRVSNRLGWVKTKTPEETRQELVSFLPERLWLPINRIFVLFGRETCKPRNPKCETCLIRKLCARVSN